MKCIHLIVAFWFSLLSSVSFAAGWSGEVIVEEIYAVNETIAIVKLSSFTNPNGCQVNSGGHVILNPTTQKTWFSMLLTAYTAKLPVNIFVGNNCTPVWANTSYAEITHVKLL